MSQTSATMPLTTASEYTTSDRMEHVKQKMILIEPRQMYEYKESKILSRLDGEMHEILQRNIANGEKAKLYSDGLSRYLNSDKPIFVEESSASDISDKTNQ